MDARHQFAADAAAHAIKPSPRRTPLAPQAQPTPTRDTRTSTFELLTLSLAGLKQDHPTPATYRRRLNFLAQTAARALTEL